jgi:anti-anti-sigma factor
MQITDRYLEECVVIDIADDSFAYPKTMVLKNHVQHLLQQGQRKLVFNLTNVTILDSFGLAVIISALKECKAVNAHLALYGLNESIARLMDLTRMDRVLDIWETEGQAIHQVMAAK